nr:SNF2-related protein [Tessaracoccus coleopterorum]
MVQAMVSSPDLGTVSLQPRAFLGRPAHGVGVVRGDALLLTPLVRPLDSGEQPLFQHGSVTVPAADVAEFAGRFLPRLRAHLTTTVDDSLDLPEPRPPRLLCRVEFHERTASVHWGFRYGLGSRQVDVGLSGGGHDSVARDPGAERELQTLVAEGPWRGPNGLQPAFLTGRSLIAFVTTALPALRADGRVDLELNEEPPDFREADEAPEVRLAVGEAEVGDWFDLSIDVTVDGEHVPLGELMRALAAGDDHLLLDSGTWFPLEAPELVELRQLIEEARLIADSEKESVFRLRPEHAGLWDELVRLGIVTGQAESWRASVGALLDPSSLPDEPVPAGLLATLRPYQETGFRWLRFLWRTGLGGILADEMGLGKTLQALAAAQAAHDAGELTEPMLVIAPTSVMGTWAAEAARFAPGLSTTTISSTLAKRGIPLSEAVGGAQIVITSYTLLRLEADAYRDLTWSAVLLDEAQFVKNHASKAYHAVRALNARVKVALTGTPLENNVMDLWSLLSITAPGCSPTRSGSRPSTASPSRRARWRCLHGCGAGSGR